MSILVGIDDFIKILSNGRYVVYCSNIDRANEFLYYLCRVYPTKLNIRISTPVSLYRDNDANCYMLQPTGIDRYSLKIDSKERCKEQGYYILDFPYDFGLSRVFAIFNPTCTRVFHNKKEFVDYLCDRKVAVNVETEKEARDFLQIVESEGILWADDIPPTKQINFEMYGSDTCYEIDSDECKLYFCDEDYFVDEGFDIIPFSKVVIININNHRITNKYFEVDVNVKKKLEKFLQKCNQS